MTLEEKNAAELAALLNGHQVTDEEGGEQVETETTEDNTASLKAQTTLDDSTTAEKPQEDSKPAPKADEEDSETLAEDEKGNRYIPAKRFDKVYGEKKTAERKVEELEKQIQALMNTGLTRSEAKTEAAKPQQVDRTQALEVELLKGKLPQFDPESSQYDPDLDQLGAEIYKANPGITMIDAARKAVKYQEKLVKEMAKITAEARLVKTVQSDQGITSRNVSSGQTQANLNDMSDAQMEKYLRDNGMW